MNFSSFGSNATSEPDHGDLSANILKNGLTIGLCVAINYINCVLVHTFVRHETLNLNPRYILYIHLVINDIILLTMLTLIHVLSYIVYSINVSLCILLVMIGTYTSMNNPMTLAVMAIECYVAVCHPLRHSQICTMVLVRDTFATAFTKNFIVVALCLILNYINGTLVITFFKHQVFYSDPRYILFIHMVLNDMVQLTITCTLFVLSYILYRINVSFCSFFILMAVFTTRNTPVNLAGMAIERYIAICNPLRHGQICTVRRTYYAIGLHRFPLGVLVSNKNMSTKDSPKKRFRSQQDFPG
ncbi:hypothetical protein WMY93_011493 [Mugilogobius chulae]|uniref:G-protein coupled receptors family 1 profile domain-containing protein n=1 Tax=Mugilogobius chulae TaxID=88201 RepID=A0AAW0P2A4_9GOBI